MSMNRREFLRAGVGLAAGAFLMDNKIAHADDDPADTDTPVLLIITPYSVLGASGQMESWTELVSQAVGLTGYQKWLPGSTGMDVFVERGTLVRSPIAGIVSVIMPYEITITALNGRVAVRCRHGVPLVPIGEEVIPGQPVAEVNDPSLDRLRWPGGQFGPPPPSGYQHLDLSVATSFRGLRVQGGAGGDINAFDYVYDHGGLPNMTIIRRTPGPPEGIIR